MSSTRGDLTTMSQNIEKSNIHEEEEETTKVEEVVARIITGATTVRDTRTIMKQTTMMIMMTGNMTDVKMQGVDTRTTMNMMMVTE